MTDRFDPALYEELKTLVLQVAESADLLKQTVLRANDVDLTAAGFDKLLDRVEEMKEALEEQLGEGAFEIDEDEEVAPDEEEDVEGDEDDEDESTSQEVES